MAITVEEGKARRRAGVEAMTVAEKIRRDLTGGRPPESELHADGGIDRSKDTAPQNSDTDSGRNPRDRTEAPKFRGLRWVCIARP